MKYQRIVSLLCVLTVVLTLACGSDRKPCHDIAYKPLARTSVSELSYPSPYLPNYLIGAKSLTLIASHELAAQSYRAELKMNLQTRQVRLSITGAVQDAHKVHPAEISLTGGLSRTPYFRVCDLQREMSVLELQALEGELHNALLHQGPGEELVEAAPVHQLLVNEGDELPILLGPYAGQEVVQIVSSNKQAILEAFEAIAPFDARYCSAEAFAALFYFSAPQYDMEFYDDFFPYCH